MVLDLVLDVANNRRDGRVRYSESRLAVLPMEVAQLGEILMNPA